MLGAGSCSQISACTAPPGPRGGILPWDLCYCHSTRGDCRFRWYLLSGRRRAISWKTGPPLAGVHTEFSLYSVLGVIIRPTAVRLPFSLVKQHGKAVPMNFIRQLTLSKRLPTRSSCFCSLFTLLPCAVVNAQLTDGTEKLKNSASSWYFVSCKLLCHYQAALRARPLGRCLNRAEASGSLWTFHLCTCC